jgi:hypothetical protein
MPLNPAAQDFTPSEKPFLQPNNHQFKQNAQQTSQIPQLDEKEGFLQLHYPNFPRHYVAHVILPGLNGESVPYLQHQTVPPGPSFQSMLAGREAAALELYTRINKRRNLTYSHVAMNPTASHLVLEMRRTLAGKVNPDEGDEVSDSLPGPWHYGYAAMVFHTIYMNEGDLARLVKGIRAVVGMREKTGFYDVL